MAGIVRLNNVNIQEFDEFYSQMRISARRMSKDQMLEVADLLHELIREQRGVEQRGVRGRSSHATSSGH